MAFCRNCGAELPEGGKFCVRCGTPVPSKDEHQAETQQPETQDMSSTPEHDTYTAPEQNNFTAPGQDGFSAPEQDAFTVPEQNSFTASEQDAFTVPEQNSFTAPEQGAFTAPEQNSFTAPGQNSFTAPNQGGYSAPQGQYATAQGGYGAPQKPVLSPEEKKKKNKKIITIAVIAVVAVAVIVAAIIIVKNILEKQATKRKTIDLSEYITVEFDGYDTMGEVSFEIDEDEFIKKALYAMKASEDNDKAVDKAEDLYYSIYVYADTSYDLSNGDTIEVNADWSKEAVRKAGVILKFKEYEVEVSGLDKIKVVDPFEFADVQFYGVDGDVSVDVVNTSDDDALSTIYFYPSQYYGLSKGDTITVTASYNSYSLLNDYGIKIEPEEKEYTVDSVDTYEVEASEITQEFIDSLEDSSLEKINDSYSYGSYKVSDIRYAGFYLLKATEATRTPQNAIFVVYEGKITKDGETKNVFLPVEYDSVVVRGDGSLYCESSYGLLWGYSNGISGYVSEKKMFDEIITDNSDSYMGAVSSGLRDYSDMVPAEDGSNVAEIEWSYYYSDALNRLMEYGLFENVEQFNIADYVDSEDIDSDSEKFMEMMNIILRTLSMDETAQMDAVGPVTVDKSIKWFYFDSDGIDYKLVYDVSGKKNNETTATDETEAEENVTVEVE